MPTLRLRIESLPAVTRTVSFDKFPVRIGRDAACEYRLDYTFVSRVHATIDLRDGRLVLRDEGSRAGTLALKDRKCLPANEWCDLACIGDEFVIGPVRFRADLDAEDTSGRRVPAPEAFEHTDSEDLDTATVQYGTVDLDPSQLDADALQTSLREALEQHRAATAALAAVLSQAASLPEDRVHAIARTLLEREPAWDAYSPVHSFVEKSGLRPAPTRADAIALRVLQDLSRYYVPYAPPLASAEAAAAFVDRLDRALSVLIAATSALRFAFLTETELEPPSDPQERDLAARLLDWTPDRSVLDELHGQLTGMVGHHRRLVSEAVSGLDRALAALNPSAIERAASAPWTPFRHRRLWTEFARRYEETVRNRPSGIGRTLVSVGEALGLLRAESCSEVVKRAPALDVRLAPA